METLAQLTALIRRRNQLEQEITALIGRPAQLGHLGEYIAAHIFDIVLEQSAAQKGFDGRFADGPLQGRTVNIKWYAAWQSILDINTSAPPRVLSSAHRPKVRNVEFTQPNTPVADRSCFSLRCVAAY